MAAYAGALAASPVPKPAPPAPDFNGEVRPILSRHCFKCHGPDEGQRMAKLRLDLPGAAVAPAGSGKRAIVPGKTDGSELVHRIFAAEPARRMPPAAANNPLSEAEKQVLKRWIAAGAKYEQHWAFVPPKPAPLPAVKLNSWPKNGIDRFVLARLEKEGLKPSPEADRYTLVRRVSLDLTGLPPTPEEADQFVNDRSPDAYEKLVDKLLASPHYGERWARRWLDLARYSDTNGYEKDRARSVWPYRDWVIHALNEDMPFDQFTLEQIAGDMLPNATPQQKIATGFHRNTMLNEEGGADPLEYRYYAMVDRVATTGTAWLGLTTGCAQCHTHKFDPIPQREYYQLMALLDNADEPEMEVPQPEVAARRAELEKQVAAVEGDLPNRFPGSDGLTGGQNLERKFSEWLAGEEKRAVRWTLLHPVSARSTMPLLTVLPDGSVLASGDQTKRDVYDVVFRTDLKGISAIRLEVLPDDSLPKHGPGRVFYEGAPGDFFLSEVTLKADGAPVSLGRATQSFGNSAGTAIDGNPQTGWSINGGQGRAHAAVFSLSQPLAAARDLSLQLLFERYHSADLGRFRVWATTDSRQVDASAFPTELEPALLTPAEQRTAEQRDRLLKYYLSVAPELAPAREEMAKLRQQMPAYPTALVFAERPPENPRATYVHRRGEWLQPMEKVEPGGLSVLNPLPPGAPKNRLTLARWLVDPKNPLTARVTVNRQWQAFFGQGIVRSTQDFGYQGEPPTHPELLDWLACSFVTGDGGRRTGAPGLPSSVSGLPASPDPRRAWSLKALHRLIVTSATYRQASRVTPLLAQRDPQNRLLARGPRVRLEAELIRDAALRASGLLSEKIGGPSVFPPQPPGVTSEGTYGPLNWQPSQGEDRYRRGLYTFSKRTAPYAMFSTFDAPSGDACVARRDVSNTPLQALTLLNDGVFVETAQALGKMIAGRAGTTEERAAYLFRRCLTRPPTGDETALLARYYGGLKERLAKKELDAATIAGPGEGDAEERAAWTLLARSVLNLDEAIVKR
jgi:hypothetical protein